MSETLPPNLRPPLDVVLARGVESIPKPPSPDGLMYEPKWDGFRLLIVGDGTTTPVVQAA
jgi:ATP-dependent DNA ligase